MLKRYKVIEILAISNKFLRSVLPEIFPRGFVQLLADQQFLPGKNNAKLNINAKLIFDKFHVK